MNLRHASDPCNVSHIILTITHRDPGESAVRRNGLAKAKAREVYWHRSSRQGSRMSNSETMTPALQQALRLLRLPALALQAQVQQALESNVMLQPDEEFDSTWVLESKPSAEGGTPWFRSPSGELERLDEPGSTLRDHLAWQLELAPLPNGPRMIGHALIDAIDDDGFLTTTPQAIAAALANELRSDAGVVESV